VAEVITQPIQCTSTAWSKARDAESLFFVGLRLQLQNVMCDMLIVYFMMNGENLILLIRCTTDGAASIALDLNDIHMSRYY